MRHLYNQKIDVIRITRTDSALGPVESESTLHSDLPCRWIWTRGEERVVTGRTGREKEATILCAVVDITAKDRIIYNSVTYEIFSVLKHDEFQNQYLEISVGVLQ